MLYNKDRPPSTFFVLVHSSLNKKATVTHHSGTIIVTDNPEDITVIPRSTGDDYLLEALETHRRNEKETDLLILKLRKDKPLLIIPPKELEDVNQYKIRVFSEHIEEVLEWCKVAIVPPTADLEPYLERWGLPNMECLEIITL
jgi:hypothetical protein